MTISNLPDPSTIVVAEPINQVVEGLHQCVANATALTYLTLNIHWNIVGKEFFSLHPALGDQYDALFDRIDVYAERIRALGAMVKGVDLNILKSKAAMPELVAPFSAQEAVKTLVAAHSKNIADLKSLVKISGDLGDLTTQNMILTDVENEEKVVWMLKAYIE